MTVGVADAVARLSAGSVVALGHALTIGDTVLCVESAAALDDPASTEAGTCQVTVGGQTLTYDEILAADDETSGVTVDTLHLTAASPASAVEGTRVLQSPEVVTYQATVYVRPLLTPYRARVPAHFVTHKALEVSTGGLCTVVEMRQDDDGEWHITDVLRKPPQINLSHASDDPMNPNAATGSIDAYPDDWANRIPPETAKSGEFSAVWTIKGSIRGGQAAGAGGYEITEQAILSRKADGTPKTVINNDPTQPDVWRGVVDADSGVFGAGLAVGGASKGLAGGSFQLRSQIDPPFVVPTVVTSWPYADGAFTVEPFARYGLAVRSTSVAFCLERVLSVGTVTGTRLVQFNPSTGAPGGAYALAGTPFPGVPLSVAWSSIRSQVYTLEASDSVIKVRSYAPPSGASCAFVAEWVWTDGDPAGPRPAISCKNITSHDFIRIAQTQPDGTVKIRTYDAGTSGTPIFPPTLTSTFSTLDVTGTTPLALNFGDLAAVLDFSGSLILAPLNTTYLDTNGNPAMPVISGGGLFGTAGTFLGTLTAAYGDPAVCGIASLDADPIAVRTWYLSRAGNRIYQHSNVFEAGAYGCVADYEDGSGNRTPAGPMVIIKKIPGSQVEIGYGDTLPPGVLKIGVYLGRSPYGLTDLWQQGVSAAGTASVDVFQVLTGTSPGPPLHPLGPGAGTLITGTPFQIQANDGTPLLDSTGGGLAFTGPIIGGTA